MTPLAERLKDTGDCPALRWRGPREIGRSALTNLFPRRRRTRDQGLSANSAEVVATPDSVISGEELEADRLAIDKAVLDNRYRSIEALFRYAKGETDSIEPDAVSGRLALMLASPEASSIKNKLLNWSLYYSDELKDLRVYHQGVQRAMITDPTAVEAVTQLAEGLLNEAEAMAVPGQQPSA